MQRTLDDTFNLLRKWRERLANLESELNQGNPQ
jgi:hypothetical protein